MLSVAAAAVAFILFLLGWESGPVLASFICMPHIHLLLTAAARAAVPVAPAPEHVAPHLAATAALTAYGFMCAVS